MLQVVRELALELLEASGEADILRRRHAEYYASFGEKAGPYLQTENSSQWLARLERDHDNLRAAIRWLLDNDPSRAAHLTASIRTYFLVKLHLAEGREWLEMALERDPHAPAPVRFNLLNNLGLMALVRGDYVEARKAFERNLSESKMSDGTLDISDSLRGLGAAASSLMDFATAQTAFEEALAIDRRSENALGLAKTLLGLGALMFFQRDFEKARALTLESLMTYRKIGYKSGICSSLLNLGEYACRTSDLTSSRKFFAEGLAIATLEGYRDRLSFCLDGFAALAAEQDDWNDAVRLMGAAEKLRETIGVSPEPDTDNFRNLYLERSLHKLGRESFSMLYEQGRAMTVDEAIALATGMHKAEKKKRIAPADDPRYAS